MIKIDGSMMFQGSKTASRSNFRWSPRFKPIKKKDRQLLIKQSQGNESVGIARSVDFQLDHHLGSFKDALIPCKFNKLIVHLH